MLHADSAAQAAPNPLMQFIPLILVMGVLYFFMIRPQSKKANEQKTMLDSLKKGDSVVTNSGLIGIISKVDDAEIILEIASGIEVKHLKASILSKYDGKLAKLSAQKEKGSKPAKDKADKDSKAS